MDIVAALFVEQFDMRQVPGPSTRFDIGGAYFSFPVAKFPAQLNPHLLVFVHAPADDPGTATFVAEFTRDGEQIARNVQPCPVEPGKFAFRLVKPEFEFTEPGTVEARCTITESGSTVMVPLTVIQGPPA
ncbi:MAG: hypothetical protein ACT4PI_13335 [Actinomycetota bacterium]